MNHLSYRVRNSSKNFLRIFEIFCGDENFDLLAEKKFYAANSTKKRKKRNFIIVTFQLKYFKTRKFLLKIFQNLRKNF